MTNIILPPIQTPAAKPLRMPWPLPVVLDKSCALALLPFRDAKWHDYSGNGNHGTLSGAAFTAKGRWGPGVSFDGVDDAVDCGNATDLDIGSGITIAAWFKPAALATAQSVIDKRAANDSGEFGIILVNSDLYFYLLRNIAGTYHGHKVSSVIVAGKLYHVVVTWPGGAISVPPKIYLNGVSQTVVDGGSAGVDGATANTTNTIRLGLKINSADDYKGIIDEAEIFKRVFSADDIARMYEVGRVL